VVTAPFCVPRAKAFRDDRTISVVHGARFAADEICAYPTERRLAPLLERSPAALWRRGPHEFVLHGHACETADQWSYIEASSYVAESREQLALSQRGKVRELSGALGLPLRDIVAELKRPYYAFDEASITTKAYSMVKCSPSFTSSNPESVRVRTTGRSSS
jgi:hypothetical protein